MAQRGRCGFWYKVWSDGWSFLKKEKLIGPNFLDWHVIKAEKKLVYREQPIPPIPTLVAPVVTGPADVLATHARWVDAQQEITCLMLTSMTPELPKNLEDFNAYDILQES
ncbi:hypothetical protein Tco_1467502 [Tanacetum coccineum]